MKAPKRCTGAEEPVLLSDGHHAWRIQYATEIVISEDDPQVSYRIFKYVIVYMDGSSRLEEKKGIPRKRL